MSGARLVVTVSAMTTFAFPTSFAGAEHGRRPARWAVVAAYLAPLVTLTSGLWRFGLVFGASMGVVIDGEPMTVSGWETAYVIGLSVVAEATALLTIGLVRPWGERAPAWMPLIGGRRVPPGPVVTVALLGSLALMYLWVGTALAYAGDELGDSFVGSGWEALFVAAYAPLLLWGPLVAAVTFDYWRRRTARGRGPAD
jgi:hypothetical protein